MRIMMIGVNHRTATVELREKLALDRLRLEQTIQQLQSRFPAAEWVILSTCCRTELYLARPIDASPSVEQVLTALAELCGLDSQLLLSASIHRENLQAVAHLFRVATGLDSMVVGEPQILGQVKQAYETASRLGAVASGLHSVFQQAIAVAKQVRTATGIDSGRVSIGSVAVDFARQIFERFDDKIVLGIGAGEMAKITLQHLRALQPAKLWLTNRTLRNAQVLAQKLGLTGQSGGARSFEELEELLVEADIVVTSAAVTKPIIRAEQFKPLLRRRRLRPLFLIDIAVPRNVDSQVGQFNNVYLYNIDDLQQVVVQTHQVRGEEAQKCEHLLMEAAKGCLADVQNRDIGHLIRSLKK